MSEPSETPASESPRSMLRPTWLEALFLLGGLALVWRYLFFFDDCFVYFRYVDNLLFMGLGLVYNEGELVEGYSSPLWTLFLIPVRACGLGWLTIVRWTGLLAFLGFGLLLVRLNREYAPRGARIVNLPLAYLAFLYGVSCYFTSGLETVLVQVLAVCCALYVREPGCRFLTVMLALGPLVRHELVLPVALCGLWAWRARGKPPWLLIGLGGLATAAWVAFRVYYYADLLPNTFYLKDEVAWGQGLAYLHDTLGPYGFYPLAAVGLASVAWLARRRSDVRAAERAVMLVAALSVAVYVVKIGGAPIHYRYLAFPFVLAVCAFAGVPELWLDQLGGSWTGARYAAPALGLALAGTSLALYPRQLDRHPLRAGAQCDYVAQINDAQYHRDRIGVDARWERRVNPASMRAWRDAGGGYDGVEVDGWCARAYRRFDKRIVHEYGLTEALLARTEMPSDRPAHKLGLRRLARDLAQLHEADPDKGAGFLRRAIDAGRAPAWLVENASTAQRIERKVYNEHRFGENLRLALTGTGRITP